ncbi:MAG: ferrous iron transport protein A [Rhodospirillales bacterium]|nr:ferrous iron transport protein A [Rhodospirillales bacterium]
MDAYSAGVGAFPLLLAAEGERVRIVAVGGGRGMDRKLSDLGLAVGSEVMIVRRDSDGPMVVARDNLRLALGAGIAHRVLVARIHEDRR